MAERNNGVGDLCYCYLHFFCLSRIDSYRQFSLLSVDFGMCHNKDCTLQSAACLFISVSIILDIYGTIVYTLLKKY